jgi:aldose sugar dehydrogenase
MKKYNSLLASLVLATLLFPACNTQRNDAGDTVSATDLTADASEGLVDTEHQEAAAAFSANCSGCHGDNATTFADRKWKWGQSQEALFASIKEGHPDEGMPAFAATFSDAEIQNLVSYIQQGIQKVAQYTPADDTQDLEGKVLRTESMNLRLEPIASDFGRVPWGMAFLPDGGMLISEIGGGLYRRYPDGKLQKVSGSPQVLAEGQGGLLDIRLHPNFSENQLVYISYSARKQQGGQILSTTAVMRARLEGNALRQPQVIFEALPWETTRHHYGSRLAFGPDGMLYVSVGDRGKHAEQYPQQLDKHPGKILRLRDDGSIPSDNPFADQGEVQASIYSYGHRNIQGMDFHPQTGQLWSHEHGPRGGDEINVVERGKNYGWPVISYGINYDGSVLTPNTRQEGMEQPLLEWTPSIAPSGLAFVSGNRYPGWEGSLLTGSLRFKYLIRNLLDGTEIKGEEKIAEGVGRLRNVKMGPDGYIYIAAEQPARIYRLVPEQ